MVDRENIAPSLLILKEYAKNADRSYEEIAKITGKPESIVAEVVKEYASVYLSQEESDFAMSLIRRYKAAAFAKKYNAIVNGDMADCSSIMQ